MGNADQTQEDQSAAEQRLREQARDTRFEVRNRAACNHLTPADVLVDLATDPSAIVRRSVASRPELPVAALWAMAHSSHEDARAAAARRSDAPIELVVSLGDDPSEDVRAAVAGNETTPIEVLEAFAGDPSEFVQMSLVRNPRVPHAVVRRLLIEGIPRVCMLALSRCDLTDEDYALIARHPRYAVRSALISHEGTPPDVAEAARRAMANRRSALSSHGTPDDG